MRRETTDWVVYAVIAPAAATAIVCFALAYGWSPRFQLGTLADWFAAIGTVAAFAAGVVVIRRDNRWKRDEEQRRHEELERQQAELITGWWDDETNEIELINNSDGMAYKVIATTGYKLIANHPDTGVGYYNGVNKPLQALPPNRTKRVPAERTYSDAELESRWLQIRFTDAGGRHWFRGGDGELRLADESPIEFLIKVGQSMGVEDPIESAREVRSTEYRPSKPRQA